MKLKQNSLFRRDVTRVGRTGPEIGRHIAGGQARQTFWVVCFEFSFFAQDIQLPVLFDVSN